MPEPRDAIRHLDTCDGSMGPTGVGYGCDCAARLHDHEGEVSMGDDNDTRPSGEPSEWARELVEHIHRLPTSRDRAAYLDRLRAEIRAEQRAEDAALAESAAWSSGAAPVCVALARRIREGKGGDDGR